MDGDRSNLVELTTEELDHVGGGTDFTASSSGTFSFAAQPGQSFSFNGTYANGQLNVSGSTTP